MKVINPENRSLPNISNISMKSSSNEELVEYVTYLEKQLEKQKEEIEKLRESLNSSEKVISEEKKLSINILESLPFPAYIKNNNNIILRVNKTFLKLLGKTAEEVIGKTYSELVEYPEIYANKIIEIEKKQDTGSVNDIEELYLTEVNRKINSGVAFIDYPFDNNIIFNELELSKAKVDITNEKKIFEAVMGALPVGVAILDKNGEFLRTNEMFDLIWGNTEIRNINMKTKITAYWLGSNKEVEPHEWASYKTIHEKKAVIGQLIKIKRFDGTETVVINSAVPVSNSDGKVIGSAVAVQDISFYIKTEEALHLSEQRFHSLFNSIDEGFSLHEIVYTITGHIKDFVFVEVNPAFERITGLKNKDIKGKTYADILPDDSQFWHDIFTGIGINGEPRKIERYFTSLKKYFQLYIYSPMPNQYATLLIDITEQKTSEIHIQLQNSILQGINQITYESIGLKDEDKIKPLCLSIIENILQSKSSFIIKSESEYKFKEATVSSLGSITLKISENYKGSRSIVNFKKFCKKEYRHGFYSNDQAFISTFFKLPEKCPILTSVICMPLIQDDEICGIIGAANKNGGYTNDDLDLLEAVCLTINQTFVQIRTNNALFESEKKYRSLFEAMNEGAALLQIIINKDKKPVDYIYVDVNTAFISSFNITLPKVLGRKASEINKKVVFLNIFYEVAVSGKPTSFETYFEGTDKFFRISAYSIESLKIAVIFTDITARKRMEEALRESEEKYRLLFNKMIDGFTFNEIIVDSKGKPIDYMFLSVNPAFEKQSGCKAIDLVGKKASEIMPVTESYWSEVFGAVALTGENIEFEYFNKLANRYYKVSAFSTRRGYFAVIYNDITNRKIAEIELQKTKNYLENLINHSNSPIVVWNPKFDIQLFNNAFEHLTGYLAEEVIGRKIDCLFPKDSVKSSKESINKLLSGTYWESVELPIYCKNEETRFVLWNIANIYDSDNKSLISTIAQGNDITERKNTLLQLEQNAKELHELNATKDKFFGIIAHDLKNPFSSILAASEILSNNFEKFDIHNIKKFSNVINSSANSAHILLENLLEWSRSQTGYIKFNPQNINLKDLVQKNMFCFEATAVNKKINIISEVTDDIYINADKNMLNTILRNLINNALKFTHPGGTIKIKYVLTNKEIIISVKDTGIGIKKADIEKLFRIDIKYTNIGTANERGTGLGLILCHEFVEKHGGKIWVESKVGKGSEFKFIIPLKN